MSGGAKRFPSEEPRRRSIRLRGYDYSRAGLYFVTICTWQREPVLGEVTDGTMRLNEAGVVVQEAWEALPDRFPTIALDTFVVMPNHVHGIVVLGANAVAEIDTRSVGALLAAPSVPNRDGGVGNGHFGTRGIEPPNQRVASEDAAGSDPAVGTRGDGGGMPPPTLAAVIRAFKSLSAIAGNRVMGRAGAPFWQRNYYEQIVRDDTALERIRQYVEANPANWTRDDENPETLPEGRCGDDVRRGPEHPV